jgi:hypothetical protein
MQPYPVHTWSVATVNKACWRAAEEWIRPKADVQRRSDPYSWSLQPFSLHRFRLFSTSYQSAFQLSLVLLVCYRSCGSVFSLGRNSSPKFPVYYQTPVVVPNVIARETVRLSGLSPAKNRVGDAVFPDHTSTPHSRTRDARTSPHNTQARKRARFQVRLFSLRSPLLGESRLISFPPLSNMLKFSGFPDRSRPTFFSVETREFPPLDFCSSTERIFLPEEEEKRERVTCG